MCLRELSQLTAENNIPIRARGLMNALNIFFSSMIGRKVIMGVTGLFLCSFLVVHLSGNVLLLTDSTGEAFNEYSHFMETNGIIRIMEFVLLFGFLFHIIDGALLTKQNRAARPTAYAAPPSPESSSWFSRNMGLTGSIILIFLIVHLKSFLVEHRFLGTDMSMYDSVATAFSEPVYTGFYVLAMILLGFHLNHGFQSAFQTLGLNDKGYAPVLQNAGLAFSILVPAGFASIPIYFFVRQ